MITRNINNIGRPITSVDGTPLEGVEVSFILAKNFIPTSTFDSITGEYISEAPTTAKTDVNGEFSIDLWPTSRGELQLEYVCKISHPHAKDIFSAPLLEDTTPVSLVDFKHAGGTITPEELTPFALHNSDYAKHLTPPQNDALDLSNSPSATNPFATISDLEFAGGHIHSNKDVLDGLSSNAGVLEFNGSPIQGGSVEPSVSDHNQLTNIGVNTHSQIDTALSRLANTSGTNTGDESAASIKSKLGVTTLVGSNSGDETPSTIKSKLGITVLSGDNTGDETAASIRSKLGISVLSGTNTGDQDLSGLALKVPTDAHIASTTSAHGGIVSSTDARLSDARAPLAHSMSTHSDWTSVQTQITANTTKLGNIVYVTDFGATTGSSDNSAAFLSALNSISSGKIIIPKGTWYGTIKLKDGVTWEGEGTNATIVIQPNGANTHVVSYLDEGKGARWWGLYNMQISGNKNNNTSGHGIYLYRNSNSSYQYGDQNAYVDKVWIVNCPENGIYIDGIGVVNSYRYYVGVVHFSNTRINSCKGWAVVANQYNDSNWYNVIMHSNWLGGLKITGSGNHHFTNIKTFWNGNGYTGDKTGSHGFYMSNLYNVDFTGCESQNDWGIGYYIDSCYNVSMANAVAENCGHDIGGIGFYLKNTTQFKVQGISWGGWTPAYQDYGIKVDGGGQGTIDLVTKQLNVASTLYLNNPTDITTFINGKLETSSTIASKANLDINVLDYGAKGDGKVLTNGVANSTTTFTSSTAGFTSADTGKTIIIIGGAGSNTNLKTTITYVNSTTVTLATAASVSASGLEFVYGTDDTAAFQSVANNQMSRSSLYSTESWNLSSVHKRTRVYVPSNRIYIFASGVTITTKDDFEWYGGGTIAFYDSTAFLVKGCMRGDFGDIEFDGLQSKESVANSTAIKYQAGDSGEWVKQCTIKGTRIYRVKNGISSSLYNGNKCGYEINVVDCRIQAYNVSGSIGVDLCTSDNIIKGNVVNGFTENFHVRVGGLQFSDNHPWNATGGIYKSDYGLVLDAGNATIVNNIFDQASIANIYVTSGAIGGLNSWKNGITIQANTFYRLAGDNNNFVKLVAPSQTDLYNTIISNNTGIADSLATNRATSAISLTNIQQGVGNAIIGPNTWDGPPNDDWARAASSIKISTDLTSNSDAAVPSVKAVNSALSAVSAGGSLYADTAGKITTKLSEAAATGGTVFIAPGTYTGNWSVPANVSLKGAGKGVTILKLANSTTAHVLQLGDNSKISDLTIDGNKVNQTNTTGGFGIMVYQVSGCTIDSVEVKNTNGIGIGIHTSPNVVIRSTYVHDTLKASDRAGAAGNVGIWAYTPSGSNLNLAISDTVCEHCGLDGIIIAGSGVSIIGGHYNYNGDGMPQPGVGAAGIYCDTVGISDVIVVGAQCRYNTGIGIDIPDNVSNIVVSGCFAEWNNNCGIGFFGVSSGVINGCVTSNNGQNAQVEWQDAGIVVKDAAGVTVTGNTSFDSQVTKTQKYGFLFTGNVNKCVAIGNNSFNNTIDYDTSGITGTGNSIIFDYTTGTSNSLSDGTF